MREHVVDAQQLGSSDLWCSLAWRPSVGMPGNTLAAASQARDEELRGTVSQEGEVMLLTQDGRGKDEAPTV